jgi:hypothetical protein
MREYPDNLIGKDKPSYLDLEMRKNCPRAKEWIPIECYDMVQCGYPLPDHGEMIIRPDGGTNVDNELLPSNGMWCKAEDVKKLIDNYERRLSIL